MRSELERLVGHLESAGGGDVRIDDAICAALRYASPDTQVKLDHRAAVQPGASPGTISFADDRTGGRRIVPSVALTFSLSSTLGLVERVLPAPIGRPPTQVVLKTSAFRGWHYEAKFFWHDQTFLGFASTPALACLAAFLKTLLALDERELDLALGAHR